MSDDLLRIGFIGGGAMTSALMDGLISKSISSPDNIYCVDEWEATRSSRGGEEGPITDLYRRSGHVIVLAVKPCNIELFCREIKVKQERAMKSRSFQGNFPVILPSDPLIISIVEGITLQELTSKLPSRRIVRVMSNMSSSFGEAGVTFIGHNLREIDKAMVQRIFGWIGVVREAEETYFDAGVTGLSGSGPAFVYQFIEALSDGGVRVGLPRSVATRLAAQTVKDAAEIVLESGKNPCELKDAVTLPGGTVIAGIEALEKGGMRGAVISAVTSAVKRFMQLEGISNDDIENKYGL